jgi:uncharacterized protein (DUF2235 family)
MPADYAFDPQRNKNIVICSDGTWNSPEDTDRGLPSPTNVCKIFKAVLTPGSPTPSNVPQLKWYDGGLGAQLGRWGNLLDFVGGVIASQTKGIAAPFSKLGVLIEGGTGLGISQNICEAYTWLCKVYQPGDRIFLFGFSRGAFTVRSLSGMIYHVGLMKSEYVSDVPLHYKRYRDWSKEVGNRAESSPDKRAVNIIKESDKLHDKNQLRIHFLGVWDTVAALGIPLWGWSFEVFRLRTAFHDTTLVPIIDNAYHAVAMDEWRSSFMPVLLKPPPPEVAKPNFEQRWFRGAHADVGGGYARCELADIALKWILVKAVACGLVVDASVLEDLKADALGPLHDAVARSSVYKGAGLWPRMFPVSDFEEDASSETGPFHPSVYQRHRKLRQTSASDSLARFEETEGWDWISSVQDGGADAGEMDPHGVYDPRERGWRKLAQDKVARVRVRADQIWCPTGIILESGKVYELTAEGSWTDLGQLSGPEGRTTWEGFKERIWSALSLKKVYEPFRSASGTQLVLGAPAALLLFVAIPFKVFWRIFFSVKAMVWWAKRDARASWMELMGMINEPTDWQRKTLGLHKLVWYLIFEDPEGLAERLFRIGKRAVIKPEKTGPLYCFANDLWLTYGNNAGSVILSVTRLSDREVDKPKLKSDSRSALIPWILNWPASLVLLAIPCAVLVLALRLLWNSGGWVSNLLLNQLIWLKDKLLALWAFFA